MPRSKDEYERERDQRIERARAYWSVAFQVMRDANEADIGVRTIVMFDHTTEIRAIVARRVLEEQLQRITLQMEALQNARQAILDCVKRLEQRHAH